MRRRSMRVEKSYADNQDDRKPFGISPEFLIDQNKILPFLS